MHNTPTTYALAVHGGAGTILRSGMSPEQERAHERALRQSLDAGGECLAKGGTALDAVELAVSTLEDCELFNAGRGAVFTHDGRHELDASIMCGRTLEAGAVAMVRGIKNPVMLAKAVLQESPFVFLCGPGAEAFAEDQSIAQVPDSYFHTEFRRQQLQEARAEQRVQLDHSDKYGTVGAVALDLSGHLAAATSTGGLTNKKFGRVGDSALIGAGTYANDRSCAVSCTGFGEYFIRGVVAYDVACLMEYANLSLEEAAHRVIHEKQTALGGDGGLISVDCHGRIAMPFNSAGMYRGWLRPGDSPRVAIYKD